MFEIIADVIILIGAVFLAITNTYKFFANSGKGIKKTVDKVASGKEKWLNEKILAVMTPVLEEKIESLKGSFCELLDKHLPERFISHDLETRRKYLTDRQKYLCDIKEEVMAEMQSQLRAIDLHEERMTVFSEVLKELLRERIMFIYGRNKSQRSVEEHERIELDKAYELYKSLGGNSYIDDYYARMTTWRTIPDDGEG